MTAEIAALRSIALAAGSRASRALALYRSGGMDSATFDAIDAAADAAWSAFNNALPR